MWWLWSFWFDVFVTIESNHQSPHFEGDASGEDIGELRGNHLHMCRLFLVDWHWNLQILSMGHREGMAIWGVFHNIKLYQAILHYGFKISSCLTRHGFQHQKKYLNLLVSISNIIWFALVGIHSPSQNGHGTLTLIGWGGDLTAQSLSENLTGFLAPQAKFQFCGLLFCVSFSLPSWHS